MELDKKEKIENEIDEGLKEVDEKIDEELKELEAEKEKATTRLRYFIIIGLAIFVIWLLIHSVALLFIKYL